MRDVLDDHEDEEFIDLDGVIVLGVRQPICAFGPHRHGGAQEITLAIIEASIPCHIEEGHRTITFGRQKKCCGKRIGLSHT